MTMELQYDATHVSDAQDKLLEQYKGNPDPEAVMAALGAETQALEDALWSIRTMTSLDTAVGSALDDIGTLVGYPRDTTDDDVYRLEIRAKIVKNVSEGDAEALIAVFKDMTDASLVIFQDNYPAGFRMSSNGTIPESLLNANLIYKLIKDTAGAGMRVGWLVLAPAQPFMYAGPLQTQGAGYGSVNAPGTGGHYSQILRTNYPFAYAGQNPNTRGYGTVYNEPMIGGNYVSAL